jgi:hypothetical protein
MLARFGAAGLLTTSSQHAVSRPTPRAIINIASAGSVLHNELAAGVQNSWYTDDAGKTLCCRVITDQQRYLLHCTPLTRVHHNISSRRVIHELAAGYKFM